VCREREGESVVWATHLMYPMSAILYSVTRGTSGDMDRVTVEDRGVALVKRLR
jgi:hypothetical protein